MTERSLLALVAGSIAAGRIKPDLGERIKNWPLWLEGVAIDSVRVARLILAEIDKSGGEP